MSDEIDGTAWRVRRVAHCRLRVVPGRWDYALTNAEAIDAYWARRQRETPAMFNGRIFVMGSSSQSRSNVDGRFEAELIETDFKSYLHWREHGFPAAGVRDCFGSALLRSAEGHVILGRQRAGNVNGGLTYLPGGFIDSRDVGPGGAVDLDTYILRELSEETGIAREEVEIGNGFIVTEHGPLISIARELRSASRAAELIARIAGHIAGDDGSELTEAVAVGTIDDIEAHAQPIHPYARQLLTWLLASGG